MVILSRPEVYFAFLSDCSKSILICSMHISKGSGSCGKMCYYYHKGLQIRDCEQAQGSLLTTRLIGMEQLPAPFHRLATPGALKKLLL
jgi:hypothetical protein